MKRFLLSLVVLVITSVCFAQDIIVQKDGSTIQAKVLKVSQSEVEYKKFGNLKGPTYTISTNELLSINYENGQRDQFGSNSIINGRQEKTVSQQCIPTKPDDKNYDLIKEYNKTYYPTPTLKKKKGKTDQYMLIFGITSQSVLSNDEVEITIERKINYLTKFGYKHLFYEINIKNKTNNIIYIDKANCFKTFQDGATYCYFNQNEVAITRGKTTGGGIGIGGILPGGLSGNTGIGGSSSSAVSRSYSIERIMSIPPNMSRIISEEKFVESQKMSPTRTSMWIGVEYAESFDFAELAQKEVGSAAVGAKLIFEDRKYYLPSIPDNLVKIGETKEYDEDNTPFKQSYCITYSKSSDFQTYSIMNFDIFLHQIIGVAKYHKLNIWNGNYSIFSDENILDISNHTIEGFYSKYIKL